MQRIRIKRTADHAPLGRGFAVITVQGGELPADSPQLYISRSGYADSELGRAGWQASECPIKPVEVVPTDGGVDYVVGPDVVGYLERGNYHLIIETADTGDRLTGVMTWRNVTPCAPPDVDARGGGRLSDVKLGSETKGREKSGNADPTEKDDAGVGTGIGTGTGTGTGTGPGPGPEQPGGSKKPWILVAIVVLAALGAIGGYLWLSQSKTPADVKEAPQPVKETDTLQAVEPPPKKESDAPKDKTEPLNPPPPVQDKPLDWRDYADASAAEQFRLGRQLQDEAIALGGDAERVAQAERFYDLAGSQGHAQAMRQRATLFDPRPLSDERVGQLDVDVQTAYNQYRRALEAGSTEAGEDLKALKPVIQSMADDGDYDALRVLRRWKD